MVDCYDILLLWLQRLYNALKDALKAYSLQNKILHNAKHGVLNYYLSN